jgi:retron-type reverse transcriptase
MRRFTSRGARVRQVARGVALAFLAGPWDEEQLVLRGRRAIDWDPALRHDPSWLRPLVEVVLGRFPQPPVDRDEDLISLISDHDVFRAAIWGGPDPIRIRRWLLPEPAMVPVEGPPRDFPVLPLASHLELEQGLGLTSLELAWFADEHGINAKTSRSPLQHYRHKWVRKARGGYRLLEAPKPRLRAIQRWLLAHLLAPIPPSPAAHGFVAGRSVRSFVAPHVGARVVIRFDLEQFFASITRARVAAIFRRVGYRAAMASTLSSLCTTATPLSVLAAHPRDGDLSERFFTNARLRDRHVAQGAPTSPALSNLAAFHLDRRLAALAKAHGAAMTRYADDLAFSGDRAFERGLRFFRAQVNAIVQDEGFRINQGKTRVMPQGRRQVLCGLVVNDRANLPRAATDRLRAVLFNAVRFGPHSQNRASHPAFRAHLQGLVAWAGSINPVRGRRLWALFDRIRWDDPGGASEP